MKSSSQQLTPPLEGAAGLNDIAKPIVVRVFVTRCHMICRLQADPDASKGSGFDWWTKYYYSIGDDQRTQEEYVQEGHDKMVVGERVWG